MRFRARTLSYRGKTPRDETKPREFLKGQPIHEKLTKQLLCFQGSVVPLSQWCETYPQGQLSRAKIVVVDSSPQSPSPGGSLVVEDHLVERTTA